jgi:predicted nucleic acid-binding protein
MIDSVAATVIVDNSALIEIVAGQPDRQLLKRLWTTSGCAPEVLDAEALNTLRRLALRGLLTDGQATAAMRQVADAPIARCPHRPLLSRAWELRHSVAGSDALYVALAEQLDSPLVTCDAKLANSHGHGAKIELYPTS